MTADDSDDELAPDLVSNSSYEDWRINLDDCTVSEDSDSESSCDLTFHHPDNKNILSKLLLKFKDDPSPPSWYSYLLSNNGLSASSERRNSFLQSQEGGDRGKPFPGKGNDEGGANCSPSTYRTSWTREARAVFKD
jgi:hypothetical protein